MNGIEPVNVTQNKIGLTLLILHVLAFFLTAFFISISFEPQAGLVWSFWALIDFPVSLLYLVMGENYSGWISTISKRWQFLQYLLYSPYVIHGLFGAVWWYFLPKFFLRRHREVD